MGILAIIMKLELLCFLYSSSHHPASRRNARTSLCGPAKWILILCALKVALVAVVRADCIVWKMRPGIFESGGKIYVLGGRDGRGNDLMEYDIASGIWTDLSPSVAGTPPSDRDKQGFAESNGKLYVFGGDDGSYENDLYEYDIASGTWVDLSSPNIGIPPSGRVYAGFAGSNGKLYVFGGSTESSSKQDLHEYDIASGKWTDLSSPSSGTPPSARINLGLAVSNSKLYVFGGYDGSNKNDLHEYDIGSGAWTELSAEAAGNPPTLRHRMSFAGSIGRLYVLGGTDESRRGDLHGYDIQTRRWANYPKVEYETATNLEFIGITASHVLDKLFCFATRGHEIVPYGYDIARQTSSWTNLPSQSAGSTIWDLVLQGFVVSDGKLYAFGSYVKDGSYSNGLHEHDIASGIWTDLSSPRAGVVPFVSMSTGLTGSNGKLYAFGGQKQDSYLARQDLHEYDIVLGKWTDLSSPRNGTIPSPREGMGLIASAGKLYVFGGYGGYGSGRMNDLHAYDIASCSWSDLSSPRVGTAPQARHFMGFTSLTGKLYVLGGSYIDDRDLHAYDIASGSWTVLSVPPESTSSVSPEKQGFVGSNGKLYTFGGYQGSPISRYSNALREYDIASNIWSDLSMPRAGTPPLPCISRLAESAGKLYVFGGANDYHEYDIASRSWKGWTHIEGVGEGPVNRAGVGLAESNNKLYVFGGYRGSYMNDLYEFDITGGSWTDLSSTSAGTAPSVRAYMGFEEWNGKLYVFGGKNGLGMLNSFFAYDIALATWIDLSLPREGAPPTPRSYLGFTKWNGKLYVYGGVDGSDNLFDLHEYHIASSTWVNVSTPSAGNPPTMGSEANGLVESMDKLFIFRGYHVVDDRKHYTDRRRYGDYGDLHQYDIASRVWTDLSSPSAGITPSARAGMGFAEWNNKLFVFGGRHFLSSSASFNDLHEYDIASGKWTDLSFKAGGPGSQPSIRAEMGFAVPNGKVYIFGGYSESPSNPLSVQGLSVLNLDCTPNGTSGCLFCLANAPSGYVPGPSSPSTDTAPGEVKMTDATTLASTPAPIPESISTASSSSFSASQANTLSLSASQANTATPPSGDVEVSAATAPAQTPTPTFWQLDVWTTMVGLTTSRFGSMSRNTFKRELSSMFATSITESDITIVNVTDMTNRRKLLAVGIQVNYLIGGFPSTSEAGAAARRIEQAETQTYLAAVLRFSPDYINLTSLVSTVSGWSPQTDRPSNTPVTDADPKTVDAAVEGDTDTGGSSGSLPIGAIVGGSFGAVLLLAAAGCFCCVAARGREAPSSVDQISTNRDEARFQA